MISSAGVAVRDLRPPFAAPGTRIGLLGGSFNPPHPAHRLISLTAIKKLKLAQVWWLVTPGNPLKDHSVLAPLRERIAASREIAKHAKIKVTALEAGLGTAYTADTLLFLRLRLPQVHFVWLMGADNLASLHRWKGWRSIMNLMPVAVEDRPEWRYRALSSPAAHSFAQFRVPEAAAGYLAVLKPPAWSYLSGPLSKLSSTALRNQGAKGVPSRRTPSI